MSAPARGHLSGGVRAKTARLSLEDVISVSEEAMERAGVAGREWTLPTSEQYPRRFENPEYWKAMEPITEFVRGVLAQAGHPMPYLKVVNHEFGLRGAQASTDGMNSITVRDVTNDLTLLHEVAHCINRSGEGTGHDEQFARTLRGLYERYLSPRAANIFWMNVTPYLDGTIASKGVTVVAGEDPQWLINGKPYRDGVWIEVEPEVWYRGGGSGEVPSRMVVRRDGEKWAWQAQVLTFIGAPHEDGGWQKSGAPKGTAKTLEAAQERALKSLAKDQEFFHRYQERQRAKTAAEDTDYSDFVMLCLRPPEQVLKTFADMDECTKDADDLHLTLAYLGTREEAGGERGRERLFRACYDMSIHSGYRGLTGQVNGFGCFMNDDTNALIALWDIPGIAEFRTHLLDYCKQHAVALRQDNHGFTPHMTLAYDDSEPFLTLPALPEGNPERVTFGSIWLVWGEDWQEIKLP